jgi:16S rRNA G966 N2-methylase RsmD
MQYSVIRNPNYDFADQGYGAIYPNIHKYPATMPPQIGIALLKELNITQGKLLDPYCGSGSSFASALECGLTEMYGFDINPLAVLISRVKFTKIDLEALQITKQQLREQIDEYLKKENSLENFPLPKITNINFWFSQEVINKLNLLRYFINQIADKNLYNFFLIPFSETVRECSYTRNNEFKLYKMKEKDILSFNPDVLGVYLKKLQDVIEIYITAYFPKLTPKTKVTINYSQFNDAEDSFDLVLTSPPYGDSRTTVAYGQFSTLANEWIGIDYARKVDKMLMGGSQTKSLYNQGLITDYIQAIAVNNEKRALEVSAFYVDLEKSIDQVAKSVKKGGKIIYIVGNRTVKNIQLPTDQFIAEKFEQNGFRHLITYERLLSNKAMPSKNSPTNESGNTVNTMLYEYIVISEKS